MSVGPVDTPRTYREAAGGDGHRQPPAPGTLERVTMAPQETRAGSSAQREHRRLRRREQARRAIGSLLLAGALGLGAVSLVAPSEQPGQPSWEVLFGMAGLGGYGLWLRRRGGANRWRHGALGEEHTAAVLDALGRRVGVRHDLALTGTRANIDHVVVTRWGVTVVETKHWAGVVRLSRREITGQGGGRRGVIEQVGMQRDMVARVLSDAGLDPPVDAVVVIHGARIRRGLRRRRRVAGVAVHTGASLGRALGRRWAWRRVRLSGAARRAVLEALDRALEAR